MRKIVLHDHMTLAILTVAQGRTCALIHTDCCVYIPDNHHDISLALTQMTNHISAIQSLGIDPLST